MRHLIWSLCFVMSAAYAADPVSDAPASAPAPTPAPAAQTLTIPLPPALLAPTPVPRAGSGPAMNSDDAVGALRNAIRRKQYGLAESILAVLPADATGYRDLVGKLSALRQEQAATYDALAEAWRNRRCGDLAQLSLSSAAYLDLAEVTRQVKDYIEIVDNAYTPTFRRINDAIIAKDKAAAQKLLEQIPSEERMLPPAAVAKRRNAVTALAGMKD